METAGGLAFIADGQTSGTGVDVLDVRDPASISLCGASGQPITAYTLEIERNRVYAAAIVNGFYVLEAPDLAPAATATPTATSTATSTSTPTATAAATTAPVSSATPVVTPTAPPAAASRHTTWLPALSR